jgi:hypothetical protein
MSWQNLRLTETQNKGWSVLSGLLFRSQCIKVSRLLERKSRGPGGQRRVIAFYRQVFEKKKGFDGLSEAEKKARWKQETIMKEYDEEKKSNRWLVQSRNRLLRLYDLVCVFSASGVRL